MERSEDVRMLCFAAGQMLGSWEAEVLTVRVKDEFETGGAVLEGRSTLTRGLYDVGAWLPRNCE